MMNEDNKKKIKIKQSQKENQNIIQKRNDNNKKQNKILRFDCVVLSFHTIKCYSAILNQPLFITCLPSLFFIHCSFCLFVYYYYC